MEWYWWLAGAVALGVAELLSLDLVLLMLAVGALAAALTSMASDEFVVQAVVGLVVAIAMLALVRPKLIARLPAGPELRIGAQRLIGVTARASEPLSAAAPGQLMISGEQWTAVPYEEAIVIDVGTTVEVVEIRGATAYVLPLDAPGLLGPL